jgi:hypothetical protein
MPLELKIAIGWIAATAVILMFNYAASRVSNGPRDIYAIEE